jgi:hypothetical protein
VSSFFWVFGIGHYSNTNSILGCPAVANSDTLF